MQLRRELAPGVGESGIERYGAAKCAGRFPGASRCGVSASELELNDGRVALSAREGFEHARRRCRLSEPAPRGREQQVRCRVPRRAREDLTGAAGGRGRIRFEQQ